MVMAPYAAMGDALFWGAVRPLSAGVALFFAARGSLWAPVVFLLLFNLPHFWFRVVGLLRGYFRGLRVVEGIQRHHLPDLAIRLKEATVVLLGGLCAYLVFLCLREEGLSAGWGLAVIPLVVLAGRLARKGVSTLLLVLVTSAILLFFFFSG
jgi:PTS system mannose-specific IID component